MRPASRRFSILLPYTRPRQDKVEISKSREHHFPLLAGLAGTRTRVKAKTWEGNVRQADVSLVLLRPDGASYTSRTGWHANDDSASDFFHSENRIPRYRLSLTLPAKTHN